jgi:RNA polymerase sigma-70 factor (ECF subfamily)
MMSDSDTADLVRCAVAGDEAATAELMGRHRQRLERMIALRLNGPLQRRLDASDILQDVYIEASRRLADYEARRPCSFFLWLRMIAGERLIVAYRRHLGTKKRDLGREIPIDAHGVPGADTSSLVFQLQDSLTSPSGVVMRHETEQQVRDVLESLSAEDRTVLVLRHFEHLSNAEVAEVLNINPSTASTRYVRALKRLQIGLSSVTGLVGE